MAAPAGRDVLLRRIRLRFGYAVAGANAAGGLIVFLFLVYVLPRAPGVRHPNRLLLLNTVVFLVFAVIALPLGWKLSARRFKDAMGWVAVRMEPTEDERALALRFPLRQQQVIAALWLTAAVTFTALNAPFSPEAASNIAVTTVLGGLVTGALTYLVGERLLRPLTAWALAGAVPARPQLPGVAARAILAWALGAGVALLGLALVGLGGLYEPRFTAQRLSIVILVLSVCGLIIGLTMMVFLARSLADPIESLRRGVGRVERGDLEEPVPVDDGSEIGLLQAGFNQMLAGLREREKLRDLFGRQVGEDVMRDALERGVELGGEARDAAILFVDIQCSTALAEARDPTEVVALLNRFFAIAVEVVDAEHGWVNKFEGDAALCVFGAPLPDPSAAAHALAAARRLQVRLRSELPEIRAGIGVSAGRVVAGNVGALQRYEYTVIGDPVNEAARLTELAKTRPGALVASGTAVAAAGELEAGHWRPAGAVQLRGRVAATEIALPVRDAESAAGRALAAG
jgi:adenylate cyclase